MKLFLIAIIVFNNYLGIAQKTYIVQYKIVDSTAPKQNFTTSFTNRTTCLTYLQTIPTTLRNIGYIAASLDTVQYMADTAFATIYIGAKYNWVQLTTTQSEATVLQLCGYSKQVVANGAINFTQVTALQNKMLTYYQNNGYPFAKIELDSIAITNNNISAKLITTKGEYYIIDSIRQIGNVTISNTFLQKHFGIRNGSMYKKNILDAIPSKIDQLPYLQQQFPYNLTMLSTSSVVNVYLKPRKSSIINVLLGVIPRPNPNGVTAPTNNKLFLSGDANILLNNIVGTGETIGLTYQQLSIKSRRINLLYKQPYIFKSDFSADGSFEIYKRDSAYLNLDAQLGTTYNIGTNTSGRLFMQFIKTNTFPDTATIRFTKKLGDNVDLSSINIGFQYELNTTNVRRSPSSGNELNTSISFGRKKILKSSGVVALKDPNFNYNSLYDTLNKNTYQLRLKATAAHYYKLGKQSIMKAGLQTGVLFSQNYFKNELYQIGGFKILRGFDEESQFCNQYAVATAEYRYRFSAESYFFAFVDGAYTNNQVGNTIQHTCIGTGAGLNLSTKGGLLNVSFAVGGRNDIPLSFKQAKLHFGYINVF